VSSVILLSEKVQEPPVASDSQDRIAEADRAVVAPDVVSLTRRASPDEASVGAKDTSSKPRVDPSPEVIESFRRFSCFAQLIGKNPIPCPSTLTPEQHAAIAALDARMKEDLDPLIVKRAARVHEFNTKRPISEAEPVVLPLGKNRTKADSKQFRARATAGPGQLVTYRDAEGVRYIFRVNPGDDVQVDNLSADITVYATLAMTGLQQILETR
jgi:hypothetical protein